MLRRSWSIYGKKVIASLMKCNRQHYSKHISDILNRLFIGHTFNWKLLSRSFQITLGVSLRIGNILDREIWRSYRMFHLKHNLLLYRSINTSKFCKKKGVGFYFVSKIYNFSLPPSVLNPSENQLFMNILYTLNLIAYWFVCFSSYNNNFISIH